MNQNMKIANSGFLTLQIFSIGLLLGCFAITGMAIAAALPKGNCADPKPYTDLKHCRYKKADLRNKDLQGTDMRMINFYKTQLQGANLTDALVDGRSITHAFLDDVKGLPAEALAIFKTSYLIKPTAHDSFELLTLPTDYQGSPQDVVGLDNIFLTQKVAKTQSTIALLSNPKYGDTPKSLIVARFDNDRFDFPSCYQSVNLMNDGHTYYWPRWESLKVMLSKNGGYLIGVLAFGNDGDEVSQSEWRKVAILELTPTCKLTLLYEEFLERSGYSKKMKDGKYTEEWCGGELSYRFINDQTAEIITTIPSSSKQTCGQNAHVREKILHKQIKLNP